MDYIIYDPCLANYFIWKTGTVTLRHTHLPPASFLNCVTPPAWIKTLVFSKSWTTPFFRKKNPREENGSTAQHLGHWALVCPAASGISSRSVSVLQGWHFSPNINKQVWLSHYKWTLEKYLKGIDNFPTDENNRQKLNLVFKKYLITLYFQVLCSNMTK